MRYVTQHFSDLQGLKGVPVCAGVLVLLHAFPPGHPPVRAVLSACGGLLALTIAWASWMNRRYKERYGFVGAAKTQPEETPGASLAMWLCFVLIGVLAISPRAYPAYSYLILNAPTYLIAKCFYACPQSGPVRLRRALYIAAALAAVGTVVYAAFCQEFFRHAFQIWLWSLLILGLYDHWLLGFLLRPRRAGLAEAAHD